MNPAKLSVKKLTLIVLWASSLFLSGSIASMRISTKLLFRSTATVSIHQYTWECPLCSDKFTTTEVFNEHKADHSMDVACLPIGHEIFECNLCSFESDPDHNVKEHMIERFSEKGRRDSKAKQ